MRYIFIVALSVSLISIQAQVPNETKITDKLAWLEGTWTRTNLKPGQKATEQWERTSESSWRGYGVSMKGVDTTFVEKLLIIRKDGELFYVADVLENKEPVYFKFTLLTPAGFVCENPSHDFPKRIEYSLKQNTLTVLTSANGKTIEFIFER